MADDFTKNFYAIRKKRDAERSAKKTISFPNIEQRIAEPQPVPTMNRPATTTAGRVSTPTPTRTFTPLGQASRLGVEPTKLPENYLTSQNREYTTSVDRMNRYGGGNLAGQQARIGATLQDEEVYNRAVDELMRQEIAKYNEKWNKQNTVTTPVGQAARLGVETTTTLPARNRKQEDNFWGQSQANYDRMRLALDEGAAFSRYVNDPTEANKAYAENIKALNQGFTEKNANLFDAVGPDGKPLSEVNKLLSQTGAGYLPQFFDQMKAGIGGAIAGGVAGSVVPVLGTAAGAKAGYVAGAGVYSYNQMQGAAYSSLIDAGIDEQTAMRAASDEALVSSMIEMADAGVDLFTLGGGAIINSITGQGIKQTAKALAKEGAYDVAESALKKYATALSKYGLNILGEGAEEFTQEYVSIANIDRMKSGDQGGGALGLAGDAVSKLIALNPEELKQAHAAGMEGLKIAAMMGGATAAFNYSVANGIDTSKAKTYGKMMKETGNVDDIVSEGLASPNDSVSFDLASKLSEKIKRGETPSDADVGKLYIANVKIVKKEQDAAAGLIDDETEIEPEPEQPDDTAPIDFPVEPEPIPVAEPEPEPIPGPIPEPVETVEQEPEPIDTVEPEPIPEPAPTTETPAEPEPIPAPVPVPFSSEEIAVRKSKLEKAGETLGKSGREVLLAYYKGEDDLPSYFGSFARVYNAGKRGSVFSNVKGGFLTAEQKKAAYEAGKADATAASDVRAEKELNAPAKSIIKNTQKGYVMAFKDKGRYYAGNGGGVSRISEKFYKELVMENASVDKGESTVFSRLTFDNGEKIEVSPKEYTEADKKFYVFDVGGTVRRIILEKRMFDAFDNGNVSFFYNPTDRNSPVLVYKNEAKTNEDYEPIGLLLTIRLTDARAGVDAEGLQDADTKSFGGGKKSSSAVSDEPTTPISKADAELNKRGDAVLRLLPKGHEGAVFSDDSGYYVTNGYMAAKVTEQYYNDFLAKHPDKDIKQKHASTAVRECTEELTMIPSEIGRDGVKVISFDIGGVGNKLWLNKKYFAMFDKKGNRFFYNPDAKFSTVLVTDSEKNPIGIILPVKPNEEQDYTSLPDAKTKVFGSRDPFENEADVEHDRGRKPSKAQLDKDYLAAAEAGDTETAQRMVDEAAKKAGYTIKAYHGTQKEFFVFDENKLSDGMFGRSFNFTTLIDKAYSYGDRVVNAFLKSQNPLTKEALSKELTSDEMTVVGRAVLGDPSYVHNKSGKNPTLASVFDSQKNQAGREIFNALAALGYDSIKIDDVVAVFSPDQIKSADPITRDDEGNIIPLSERFNPDNEDIRYSKSVATVEGAHSAATPIQNWDATRISDGKVTQAKSISDIVAKIRHDYDIPITTGHIRSKNVLGQYDRKHVGIRSKVANSLPTIAHELGHHIAKTYEMFKGLSPETRDELQNGMEPGFRAAYKPQQWTSEGFAEFIRQYLQNRETAAIKYPLSTALLEAKLPATAMNMLNDFADEINAYYVMGTDTAASTIKRLHSKPTDYRTLSEKLSDKSDVFYQSWVDALHAIKRFDDALGTNVYKHASNSMYSDARAYETLVGDMYDYGGNKIGDGLKAALKGIKVGDTKEYNDFGEYLLVRHGPERLKQGMRIFGDDRMNSTLYMEARQAELEKQYPNFEKAAKNLDDFQRNLLYTWGVNTGLIDDMTAMAWNDRWQHYVPLNRVIDDKVSSSTNARRGFANQSNPYKRAKGSGRDIVHPVDSIVRNMVVLVNAGTRNNVMNLISNAASKSKGSASYMEKIPAELMAKNFRTEDVKRKLLKTTSIANQSGLLSDDASDVIGDIINSLDETILQFSTGKAHGDIITVMKNGKPEFWKVNDEALLSSISNMAPAKVGTVFEAYGRITRFMMSNATGKNIVWSLFSNAPRDFGSLMVYSEDKNLGHLVGGIADAYKNRVKGADADPMFKEFLGMGGGRTSAYSADKDLARQVMKKISGSKAQYANPLEWIDFVADTIELGPRYAYYKIMRTRLNMNPQEAFYAAMDVTVNFRRGGTLSRQVNKVVPFFNAGMQGADKFYRWISAEDVSKDKRSDVARNRVMQLVGTSLVLAVMMSALNGGDDDKREDYAQLSNYTKNSYFCFPMGDGKFFCVQKPREVGIVMSGFQAAIERYAFDNPDAFDGFYEYASGTMLPGVVSNVAQGDIFGAVGDLGLIGTVYYVGANRDFLGRPIVSSGLENVEAKDQYNNRTSKLAYLLGQTTGISPMKIDFVANQIFGGFWKWQRALFPLGESERDLTLGVKNTYVKDNLYSTDVVDKFYDRKEKLEKASNSDKTDMDKKIAYKEANSLATFYSNFSRLSKELPDTEKNRAVRQTVIDMLDEYNRSAENDYTSNIERIVAKVCKSVGETEIMPSVMNTYVTDANKKQHQLSASAYVDYQTDYLGRYWQYCEDYLYGKGKLTIKEQEAIIKAAKKKAREDATTIVAKRLGITLE